MYFWPWRYNWLPTYLEITVWIESIILHERVLGMLFVCLLRLAEKRRRLRLRSTYFALEFWYEFELWVELCLKGFGGVGLKF